MKRLLGYCVLALVFSTNIKAEEAGRYAVSASETKTVLVDTKTGTSWILLPTQYKEGFASDKQYQWNRIGFAKGSSPKKKR